MQVRFGGLARQYLRLKAEIDPAVERVLASGNYIAGPELEAFEEAFGRFSSAAHVIGVASGTDAITLALVAAGIGPGDEVIVPAVSAYPTVVGVARAGATPVFADILPDTGLIDAAAVAALVGERTRALLPVHLYGVPADLDALSSLAEAHRLAIVEDCAQAHGTLHRGRPVGRAGIAAAWSFYPTKNVGGAGDGGAVATQDERIAAKVRRLRNYGQSNRYEHEELGLNSRLDPLQAAILGVKLRHAAGENERRRAIAARYDEGIAGLDAVRSLAVPAHCSSSRHLYPVLVTDAARRPLLQRALGDAGVETLIHYPIAMPDQRATPATWRRGDYPAARRFCSSVLSLPLHPDLTDEEVEHVVASVRAAAGAH